MNWSGDCGVQGVPGITGCPNCGKNRFKYNPNPPYYCYCKCGWKGVPSELLTEAKYKQKIREKKLIKIKNYEN